MKVTDPDVRGAVGAVARHPGLWATVVTAGARHLPRRGRSPSAWMRFRMETAYGAERDMPTEQDLITWLRWARAWPRVKGPSH